MMKSQLTELSRVLSYPTGLRCDIWFSYPPARILRATEGGMEKRRMAQQSRQEYLESHLSAPDRVAEGRSSGSCRQTLKRTLYGTTRSGSLLKQMIPIKTDQWDVTKRTLVGGERYESLEALAALNTL
jgi:hypothetical protein